MFSIRRALSRDLLASPAFAVRGVAVVAAAFWAFVIAYIAIARWDGDVRTLISIGTEPKLPPVFASVPRVGPWGYDGQWYAVLSTDPLLRSPDTLEGLDSPSYRATRILVPLLAWLLALGSQSTALLTYQLVCWAFGIAAVILVANWLAAERASPWLALLLIPGAGLASTTIRTMPDAGGLFLVLAAVLAYARGRRTLAVALLCAAVLARETSYLAALAFAACEVRRKRLLPAALAAAVPLAVVVGWQLYLRGVVGSAFDSGSGNFSIPLAWLPKKIAELFFGQEFWWSEFFGLLAILATIAAFALIAARPSTWGPVELAFLAFAGLGLVLGYSVYVEAWAYARALLAVPFLAVVLAPRQTPGWRRTVLLSIAAFYALAGITLARGELRDAQAGRGFFAALRHSEEPPQARALYVMPVANVKGRGGSRWRTALEIANLAPNRNPVTVELFPAETTPAEETRRSLDFGVGQHRVYRNAAEELFNFTGSGALRLVPRDGPIRVECLTFNVRAGGDPGSLLPALTSERAILAGFAGRLSGLAYDPAERAGVRTNLALLNPHPAGLEVAIELFDDAGRRLGTFGEAVPGQGFVQVDDVFARVTAPKLDNGGATVRAATPGGAFLAVGSIIRGGHATAEYVFPERLREAPPAGR